MATIYYYYYLKYDQYYLLLQIMYYLLLSYFYGYCFFLPLQSQRRERTYLPLVRESGSLLQDLAVFRLQYFSCLPLKISSYEFHSILKMISASRRIFFVILPLFCPQYFDCLPLKISSHEFHSILKMISASRRIFFIFTFQHLIL